MADVRPFSSYESKWQDHWEREGTYRAEDASTAKKCYGLIEFPYPSGDGLHVGHPRSYTAIDVVTRKQRMEGKNVLYPIGFDAFGLPTENFAIKHQIKPQDATIKNVANFTRQLKALGLGFDWSRAINTTDQEYYKWTQWMFLQFFKSTFDEKTTRAQLAAQPNTAVTMESVEASSRMAYKARTTINWCPNCKIGLANEEAIGGVCERCGNPVEKREKAQWMIGITKYAERLLKDLETVDYLERIKAQQINWIGKSEGAYVDFQITNASSQDQAVKIRVFTTRPDTLFGAMYIVLAPEHELITQWMHSGTITNEREVNAYRATAAKKSDIERGAEGKEKTGVRLEGISAINPATKEEIPVWIADYVLAGYGTGAIMAVPAHDERDFAFAKKFDLPIRYVIAPHVVDHRHPPVPDQPTVARRMVHSLVRNPKTDEYLCLKWKEHPWTTFVLGGVEEGEDPLDAAKREVREETGYTDLKLVHDFGGPIISEYNASHKGENRLATATGYLFELASDDRKSILQAETDKHEPIWLHRNEITSERMTCSELDFWLNAIDHPEGQAYTGDGIVIASDFLNNCSVADAKEKMAAWLEKEGHGTRATNYKLRDWVFSRQRYWGEPIPIIICNACGYVPVPEEQLPIVLPDVESYQPTDTGESPLSQIRSWVEVACPSCGGAAERETDTMPNWAGSSWYFLRYCDPHNNTAFADAEKLKYWMPVDLYNGGMEHTTLHLLYSRFWHKFLWDIGALPAEIGPEPYRARRSHGLILAEGGEKMSKSKGNVVNPDDIVSQYGADVFRVYEMFMGPFDQPVPWDTNGIEGVRRFLDKAWRLLSEDANPAISPALETIYHQSVKKVGEDIESLSFNTAVSQLMIVTNAFLEAKGVPAAFREGYVQLLAPFAPHLTEELWSRMGHTDSVHRSAWPVFDPSKIVADTFELVVQVNGKVRDRINVPANISEEEAKTRALASESVQRYLEGKAPSKILYIKGKLVTVVV